MGLTGSEWASTCETEPRAGRPYAPSNLLRQSGDQSRRSTAEAHSAPPLPIGRSSATEHLAVVDEPEEVVPSRREAKVDDPTLAFVKAACPMVDLDHSQPRLAMTLLIDPLEALAQQERSHTRAPCRRIDVQHGDLRQVLWSGQQVVCLDYSKHVVSLGRHEYNARVGFDASRPVEGPSLLRLGFQHARREIAGVRRTPGTQVALGGAEDVGQLSTTHARFHTAMMLGSPRLLPAIWTGC